MMKKTLFLCFLCGFGLYAVSCSSKSSSGIPVEYSRILKPRGGGSVPTHRWFYFTEQGFKETDVPRNAPAIHKKPWTEAVRITSSVLIDDTGYFLVNKLGMLVCPAASGLQKEGIASKTVLVKDAAVFSAAACGSLFRIGGAPVFNMYTNSIFSQSSRQAGLSGQTSSPSAGQHPAFLIRYDSESRSFIPLLQYTSFDWPSGAELREFFFSGGIWYALLKEQSARHTEFYAYAFSAADTVFAAAEKINCTKIDMQEFREKLRPDPASEMPQQMAALLAPVPPSVPWYLEHNAEDTQAPLRFVQREHAPNPRQAYSLSTRYYSAALFEDGTVCFAGTLPMKHVINGGKPVVFKLPPLPAGYIYAHIVIAGSTLFAAWEETDFFETGRSGFVAVDSERILYGNGK